MDSQLFGCIILCGIHYRNWWDADGTDVRETLNTTAERIESFFSLKRVVCGMQSMLEAKRPVLRFAERAQKCSWLRATSWHYSEASSAVRLTRQHELRCDSGCHSHLTEQLRRFCSSWMLYENLVRRLFLLECNIRTTIHAESSILHDSLFYENVISEWKSCLIGNLQKFTNYIIQPAFEMACVQSN